MVVTYSARSQQRCICLCILWECREYAGGKSGRDISCAHLTPDIANFDDGIETQLDLQSTRKYQLLCGTRSQRGTCHHGMPTALVHSSSGFSQRFRISSQKQFTRGVLASRLLRFCQENSEACDKLDGLVETIETVSGLSG